MTTLDRAVGCDLQLDLVAEELPDLSEIDVCVSSAAITDMIAPAHRMTQEQWSRDINVNLSGAFRAVQSCLTGMLERRWGRVVVISSGAAVDRDLAELDLSGAFARAFGQHLGNANGQLLRHRRGAYWRPLRVK